MARTGFHGLKKASAGRASTPPPKRITGRKRAITPARSRGRTSSELEAVSVTYDRLSGSLYPSSDYQRKYET